MMRILYLVVLIVAMFSGSASANSDSESEKIQELRKKLAVQESALGPEHQEVAKTLVKLVDIYVDQGRYEQAEPLCKRLLAMVEKALGPDHPVVGTFLHRLAQLYVAQGLFAQAEPPLKRALALHEKALGPDHPNVATSLNNLAVLYHNQGLYAQAEPLLKRSLTLHEKAFGAEHSAVAMSLNNLASSYEHQGLYAQAEPLYQRALVMREKALGLDHPDVAMSLNNLAVLYLKQGLYALTEPLLKRALVIIEKALGAEHPAVATALNNLASSYENQGLYAQAEPLYQRGLAIREKALGAEHPDVATSLNSLALLYDEQGFYAQAEPLLKRALALNEKALGPDHPNVALSLNNLAMRYAGQGLYDQVEPLHQRALAIREKVLGAEHPDVAMSLHNLASLYSNQGAHAQAEPLLKRALAIYEKALGSDHPDVAMSLNSLATLYSSQGLFAQAEPLHKRVLVIIEKALGLNHPSVALSLHNLAALYVAQGLYAQAEPLHQRALAIREKALGPDHEYVATSLSNLALLYDKQGLYAQAEPLYQRGLAIREQALGAEHPDVALSLNNLALFYQQQGLYAQAEPMLVRALTIREKALGPNHPDVEVSLENLAFLASEQGSAESALTYVRRATAIARRHLYQDAFQQLRRLAGGKSGLFRGHLDLLAKADTAVFSAGKESENFELIQLAQDDATARDITLSLARQSAPNTQMGLVVRRQQDAIQAYRQTDALLINSIGEASAKRRPAHEAGLRERIQSLDSEIAALNKKITKDFPDYAALTSSEPLPLADAQALLRPDEALLAFVSNSKALHVAVVRPGSARMVDIPLERESIATLVKQLRASLQAENPLTTPYDTAAAYQLYLQLFSPLLPHLDGVRDIAVVTDSALSSLPLGVLLETPPKNGETIGLKDYRHLDWLAKRFNFTTLPAVISLKALRRHGKAPTAGQQPFLGIGNPVLKGSEGDLRGSKQATGDAEAMPIAALRNLPALPDTADELLSIARTLGGSPEAIYLQQDATEANLKRLPLDRYRVLGFATHGLLGGEIKGLVEPGLVLTPPVNASEADDGFLAASEVAQLKLNADWVVLSACNTAGSDGVVGSSRLSGLAKSFFYAGARSLLVSHWPVISSATTRLITDTFTLHAANRHLGKAGALRQAMINMINSEDDPEYAHPAFWAPFVIVGEGG
jgi:CHAT domain-containing protein